MRNAEFTLSGNANAAKQCATVSAISSPLLLKVARCDCEAQTYAILSVYQQVISNMLGNQIIKSTGLEIDLCCIYKRQLQHHQHPLDIFEAAVSCVGC